MNHSSKTSSCFWKKPWVLGSVLILGYWVYTYHLEHAMGFLPYLILLLCPFMHVFMHGGHGHSGHANKNEEHSEHKNHRGDEHA